LGARREEIDRGALDVKSAGEGLREEVARERAEAVPIQIERDRDQREDDEEEQERDEEPERPGDAAEDVPPRFLVLRYGRAASRFHLFPHRARLRRSWGQAPCNPCP